MTSIDHDDCVEAGADQLIVILTAQFPFLRGEQFLEAELEHWADVGSVVFAPIEVAGDPRPLLSNMSVDPSLARARENWAKFKYLHAVRALLHPVFWRELRRIWACRHRAGMARQALVTLAMAIQSRRGIEQVVRRYGRPSLVYCYWNDLEAFGAVMSKRAGIVDLVVSRAHGFDVYAERRPFHYMPLKAQLIGDLDGLYPVSEDGRRYLCERFGAPVDRTVVQRLGVRLPDSAATPSGPNEHHIVSISNCHSVKRLDRAILGIAQAARSLADVKFRWTHIGDGPERAALESLAVSTIGPLPNVEFSFTGAIDNNDVRHFLSDGSVDVLLNTSESEGVPVSMMESMSYGVPVIAPEVGGISEIVGSDSGWLMTASPNVDEIAACIADSVIRAGSPALREAARARIATNYDADSNHRSFVQRCLELTNT